MKRPLIYIAGKFEAQERLKHERERIHRLGLGTVVGTWLDEESSQTEITAEQKLEYALRDITEVAKAQLLILDTFDENFRGGREVEYGVAVGLRLAGAANRFWVVGPKRNVFHELAAAQGAHFLGWDDVIDALTEAQELIEAALKTQKVA